MDHNSETVEIVLKTGEVITLDKVDADLARGWFFISRGRVYIGPSRRTAAHIVGERIVGRELPKSSYVLNVSGNRYDLRRTNLRVVDRHLSSVHEQAPRSKQDGTIEIPLGSGVVALVDQIDGHLAKYTWSLSRKNQYTTEILHSQSLDRLRLHRVVMQRSLGRPLATHCVVKHVNGDVLDNRRSNLKIVKVGDFSSWMVTKSPKAKKIKWSKRGAGSKAGYKGVSFFAPRCLWKAEIQHEKRRFVVGYFRDILEAALAHDRMAFKLKGDKAKTNYPAFASAYQK